VLVSKGEAVLTERPESDIETVLKEAITLANYGLTVSCRSAKLRTKLAAAVQCIAWLRHMCGASDATCSLAGDAFTDDTLHKLMAADMYLPRRYVHMLKISAQSLHFSRVFMCCERKYCIH
jgi:hypothetical protein